MLLTVSGMKCSVMQLPSLSQPACLDKCFIYRLGVTSSCGGEGEQLHFTDEQMEAQRSQVTCSRSHGGKWQSSQSYPGLWTLDMAWFFWVVGFLHGWGELGSKGLGGWAGISVNKCQLLSQVV